MKEHNPFGSKLRELIVEAKESASRNEFTASIQSTIQDLNSILEQAFNNVKESTQGCSDIDPNDHFKGPELETSEFDVDALLGDKTDDDEVISTVRKAVSDYAYLFVALGVALNREDTRREIECSKNKHKLES